jgi:hypothetical protein
MAASGQTVSGYGISLSAPAGWDSIIYQRDAANEGSTLPVLQASTMSLGSLPLSDFGTDVYPLLGDTDIFFALIEYAYDPNATVFTTATSIPSFATTDFSPTAFPRLSPPKVACQAFFSTAGRAFCLYVVLGNPQNADSLVSELNSLMSTLVIAQAAPSTT